MAVEAVSSVTSAPAAASASSMGSLDRDAFLKLLITQLRNQDPMQPLEDKEFIAQLAQFSSLEQMQQLNSAFQTVERSTTVNQAFSLVGGVVEYADLESGTVVRGKVDSVVFDYGWPRLKIGKALVDPGNVITVLESGNGNGTTAQAFSLIGRTVEYRDLETGAKLTGTVGSISLTNGLPKLNIGDASIDPSMVLTVY